MVLNSKYGMGFYHFLVENLPRVVVVLDVLLENPDIKVNTGADLLACLSPPAVSIVRSYT